MKNVESRIKSIKYAMSYPRTYEHILLHGKGGVRLLISWPANGAVMPGYPGGPMEFQGHKEAGESEPEDGVTRRT